MFESITEWDISVLYWIQENFRGVFDPVMKFLSVVGYGGAIWFVFIIIIAFMKKYRKGASLAAISICGTYLINDIIIKNIVMRPRPFNTSDILIPLDTPSSYSFPSGHTAAAFAVSLILIHFLPKIPGILFVILAVLISFSRMYLGAHFPTDVMCGFLVAVVTSQLLWYLFGRKWLEKPETVKEEKAQ